MRADTIIIELPDWSRDFIGRLPERIEDRFERVKIAVKLAHLNCVHGTGGPFGALIAEPDSGRVLSIGVNLVPTLKISIAHAEIIAISLAQKAAGRIHLQGYELVSSCEPCAMCLGAIPWSGISSLVYGAAETDAREAGFDEGDKPAGWKDIFTKRGICIYPEVLRDEARKVLLDYKGPRY